MWLADGDFTIPIPGNVAGIAIAAIMATAVVLVALLKRRPSENEVRPALEDSTAVSTAGLVDLVMKRNQEITDLRIEVAQRDALLDEAYQAGFQPQKERPSPGRAPDGEH